MKLMEIEVEGEDLNFIEDKINAKVDCLFEKDPEGKPFNSDGLLSGKFTVVINWEEI